MSEEITPGKANSKRQKVTSDAIAGSDQLDANNLSQNIDLGMAAEKVTLLSSGDLAADVDLEIGGVKVGATVALVAGTPQTISPTHLVKNAKITRTSGSGRVLILAK